MIRVPLSVLAYTTSRPNPSLSNRCARYRHHPAFSPSTSLSSPFISSLPSYSTLTSASPSCCKCRPRCCLSGKGTCRCCRSSQKVPRIHLHNKQFSTSAIMATEYKLKDISSLQDIPNYEKVESEVEGVPDGKVLVVRLEDDKFHAISPRCTHYGAPLKLGVVAPDGRITCPWHGGTSPMQTTN
jgi:nitrite reductase/ring-hydroxylating ferredoxin subunit